ncbi:hypothetical protein JTE90_027829 [Oedothorax gibbosus]|uniref:TGF-beta family profile domain-containing protein n=1 Tax=Oedothorax gibbosus TaxID=931172 RepID=A0AAV6U4P0_9ARAC|nr:hypothetical protein JTE90_027829 [Oedothorax gibbosus]
MLLGLCIASLLTASVVAVPVVTFDEATDNSLPDVIRRSGSSMVMIVNVSSPVEFEDETIANASSTLSNTSFADIENDNLTHILQMRYRERKKQERITLIRSQILTRLHMNGQPNISTSKFSEDDQMKIASMIERLQNQNTLSDSTLPGNVPMNTIQWLQSFYPSCMVPNNTDKSVWEQDGTFRILYDIPFSKFPNDITIMMAKLRLYKLVGNVDPNYVGWDATRPRFNVFEGLVNSRAANGINVNVYQYFKPLRTNKREKKRIVDSRIVSLDYEGWVEFNIATSVNFWFRHSNRNFGMDIEVEDAFGNKLNPNLYFQNLNCTLDAHHDSPFPNIMELHRGEMNNNETANLFDNETYPTLDLRTAQLPRTIEEVNIRIEDEVKDRILRKRSTENSTCKKELEYVSFSDIGLDEYIMWPQGVLWTFCDGGCDPNKITEENREYFFSSWLQRYLKLKRRTTTDCVVTRRESLPVILFDGDNKVVDTVLEDFVPVNCGCRAS